MPISPSRADAALHGDEGRDNRMRHRIAWALCIVGVAGVLRRSVPFLWRGGLKWEAGIVAIGLTNLCLGYLIAYLKREPFWTWRGLIPGRASAVSSPEASQP